MSRTVSGNLIFMFMCPKADQLWPGHERELLGVIEIFYILTMVVDI